MSAKRLPVKLTPAEHEAIRAAAERAGMSVHGWMRAILLAAAGASELPEQLQRVTKAVRQTAARKEMGDE